MAGLALKMYRSFECLIRDCEDQRLESMHHLRPIVETFIYYMWVARDTGAIRAKLIHTKAISEKLKFFKANSDYPDAPAHISNLEDLLTQARISIQDEWNLFKTKKIESIAGEAEINDWYKRVYRLACEPIHLTDLASHVPSDLRFIDLGNPKDTIFWAYIALDYSTGMLISVFSGIFHQYSLGLENEINS